MLIFLWSFTPGTPIVGSGTPPGVVATTTSTPKAGTGTPPTTTTATTTTPQATAK